MATLVNKKNKVWEQKKGEDFMEYLNRTEKEFDKIMAQSNKINLEGDLTGLIVSFPWADGCAFYQVVKSEPLQLSHIPFGDAWEVPYSQIRGLRRKDIVRNTIFRRGSNNP